MPRKNSDFAHPHVKTGVCVTMAMTFPVVLATSAIKGSTFTEASYMSSAFVSLCGMSATINRPYLVTTVVRALIKYFESRSGRGSNDESKDRKQTRSKEDSGDGDLS